MLSSSLSLHSGSFVGDPELPLIPCKICNGVVKELVSKQPFTTRRKFYRCMTNKEGWALCQFFHWQASYAVLLLRDRIVTNRDELTELVMIALDDHSKAMDCLTTSIRDMRQKLDNLEVFMKQELDNMNAAMVENEKNKKSTASALQLMEGDLRKLKGSTTVKPRKLAMYSLGFLLLAILIGWFVMGHMNGEEAFRRHMLSP